MSDTIKLALLIIRGFMLLFLLLMTLFWYLPSMRQLHEYERARDTVFNAAENCWQREYESHHYAEANRCLDSYSTWIMKNEQPDSGINWPWVSWRGQP